MIMLSKEANRLVNTKSISHEDLTKYLYESYTVVDLASSLAEFILKSKETTPQISVTQEELDRITSLFKVKGVRCVEGNYIKETRGRRPKTNNSEE